eukprot:gene3142-13844_t
MISCGTSVNDFKIYPNYYYKIHGIRHFFVVKEGNSGEEKATEGFVQGYMLGNQVTEQDKSDTQSAESEEDYYANL